MTLFYLDYFRCEPLELNFRLHVLGGFWPLETESKWKKYAFSVFSYLCYFSFTSMVAIQVADIFLLWNDPVRLTGDLSIIIVSVLITVKSIFLLYKVELVNDLKKEMTEFKNSRWDPDDVEIMENSNRQILTVVKTFYGLTVPCVIFWLLYPGLDKSAQKQIPFPYLLPVEEWTQPIYIGVYVYQAVAMIGFMINVLSVDAIFCSFIIRINAHYDILIKNITVLGKEADIHSSESQEHVQLLVSDSIQLHKKILAQIGALKTIYGGPTIIHFLAVTPLLGIIIIDLLRAAKGFRLKIFQKLLYFAIALWDTFLYCFFANKLQEKSYELSFAIYNAHWYKLSPKLRRDLIFILFKCQKVPKIQLWKLFSIDLKTFVNIIKIAYDVTALLVKTV